MRARTVLVVLLLAFGVFPSAAGADVYFLRGGGLAFPDALPDAGEALEVVGRLDASQCHLPFALDPDVHEYTWTVYGPVVHRIDESAPGIRTLHLTFGLFELREDPQQNSAYFPDPPNPYVPSTFHDGETILLGALTSLRIRDIFGIVTASGDLSFETGRKLGELNAVTLWSFSAAVSEFGADIPLGYGSRWSLEIAPHGSLGVAEGSWGQIKALYR